MYRVFNRLSGRGVTVGVGLCYVLAALLFPTTTPAGDMSVADVALTSSLTGTSGLVMACGGYLLARTNVRPDLYHVVARWCLRAIAVMASIILFLWLVAQMRTLVVNLMILTGLAGVAGLGMGYHDGKAKTRAVDAEEYSRELERYRTIVETVNDGIFVANPDNRFTLVNDAYCVMTGYDREELVGSHTSLVADEEREDAATIIDGIEDDLATGTSETDTYETVLETKSGETFEAEWSVAPLPRQGDGSPDRVVVVRDVTERNERERRLERQNEQLDNFASMLAHELRNPVTIGQIYGRQLPREEDAQAVEYVREAFDRIENMIDVILLVARGREAVASGSTVQLADVARQAWADIDAPEATLEVVTDLTAEVDETYVRHLFRNLFENAVEHGSTSSQSSTDDAVEHGGSAVTVTVGPLPTGFYVADDGTGIPTDERESVFESGYTSGASDGMGLGLTFVQEMADVYGWEYTVTESADGGARFEFENVTRTTRTTD